MQEKNVYIAACNLIRIFFGYLYVIIITLPSNPSVYYNAISVAWFLLFCCRFILISFYFLL